ncbi:hypothetical protein [Brevibacillus dissolubilis]|uniref:hypothetical protein n=1 Tax=Brevibacillus dissolubilis TaxID=1844116 RepID=UPI0011171FF2|nr:hypothetical protein [Brevibacillus dissolubilis]
MVTMDSSIAFLIYITAVSSAAAGVTEAMKSAVPFLAHDYVPKNDSIEAQNLALKFTQLKKFLNLVISVIAAGILFAIIGIDPAAILTQNQQISLMNQWGMGVWAWGLVAVFGSPMFHSLLKIIQGFQETMSDKLPGKPTKKV